MFWLLERKGHLSGFTVKNCHVRCMGHIINLAVQVLLKTLRVTVHANVTQLADKSEDDNEALEEAEERIVDSTKVSKASLKGRRIIAKIRYSNQLWEALQAQSLAAKISPKRPILDMPIHWNSMHAMLERLIELQVLIDAICRLVFYPIAEVVSLLY